MGLETVTGKAVKREFGFLLSRLRGGNAHCRTTLERRVVVAIEGWRMKYNEGLSKNDEWMFQSST